MDAKPTKEEKSVCPICADTYTAVLRRKVVCTFCEKDACTKCIEQYLLSRPEDAHCIHCRVNYSDTILKSICTRTYLQQTYYRHRQEILVSRERANLPGLQDDAQRLKRHRARMTAERELLTHLAPLNTRRKQLLIQHSRTYSAMVEKIKKKECKEAEQEALKCLSDMIQHINLAIHEKNAEIRMARIARRTLEEEEEKGGADGAGGEEEKDGDEKRGDKGERKKFIRRCMKAGCQGFLSTAWKCGLCENYSCGKCFTVKGPNHDSNHTCTKEDLATADMIRQDSKPCPNCGEFINRSSGCFGRDTPLLLGDGTTTMSQDIKVGDQLVGDDGQPRTVQALLHGVEELYEVRQMHAMSYVVNGGHTLVLRQGDKVVERTVHDFLALPPHTQAEHRGYKATPNEEESALSITPLGLGEFYGWQVDGNRRFLLRDGTVVKNCSQIWCVTCRTPWDWNTGKIVTKGAIHNPHYYEWIKRTGGEMPRHPADVPCGGFPAVYELRAVNRTGSTRYSHYFYEFHRLCMEIQERSERQYRSHLEEDGLRETHISFLLGDYDEKEWGRRLARAEKKRKMDAEIQEVFAAFRMVAVELLNRIQHYRDETYDAFVLLPREKADMYLIAWNKEARVLIEMVNEGMKSISLTYGCHTPWIRVIDSSYTTHYRLLREKWTIERKRKDTGKDTSKDTRKDKDTPEQDSSEEEEEEEEEEEKEKEEEEDPSEDALHLALERSLLEQ